MNLREVVTEPFLDQKFGTAGLRKKVRVFAQSHYLENLLQCIFEAAPSLRGGTLVIGGDGRFHNRIAIETAIRMAAANGVSRLIVGQGGIISTPATSQIIRESQAAGGLMFSASHNPAGPDGDFGVKFNIAGGGQAPEETTNHIYALTQKVHRYHIMEGGVVDIDRRGSFTVGSCSVEVVDGVDAYARLMQEIFNFEQMRQWIADGGRVVFDAMHAVTGPYAQRIFGQLLGSASADLQNCVPLADFGGGHPDPNLIYGKHLVELVHSAEAPDIAAASDGDGDRNMILGRGIFISPGDSLAMLAAQLHRIPAYAGGVVGIARSMPTCRAADVVAHGLGVPCYETPTGWKFFCNLLDAEKITLCGEESFGTSSTHVREKDGLWAVLAWLNIVADSGKSVAQIAQEHWQRFGRHYYARHDFDNLSTEAAKSVMQALTAQLAALPGQSLADYQVTLADSFAYQDPIDGSSTKDQGLRIVFGDRARIIVRLSGTGTEGATLRLYFERYEREQLGLDNNHALAPLVSLATELLGLQTRINRTAPDVVT